MKNLKKALFLFFAVSVFAVADSKAQIVVRVRPERPREIVVARPMAPSPRHVWVAEEWTSAGGRYAYHGGYWALPPHPHAVWVAGHWRNRPRGYVWVPGHWA
jgi:hypothetical protein